MLILIHSILMKNNVSGEITAAISSDNQKSTLRLVEINLYRRPAFQYLHLYKYSICTFFRYKYFTDIYLKMCEYQHYAFFFYLEFGMIPCFQCK